MNFYEAFLAQFTPQGGALFIGNNSIEQSDAVLLGFCKASVRKDYFQKNVPR